MVISIGYIYHPKKQEETRGIIPEDCHFQARSTAQVVLNTGINVPATAVHFYSPLNIKSIFTISLMWIPMWCVLLSFLLLLHMASNLSYLWVTKSSELTGEAQCLQRTLCWESCGDSHSSPGWPETQRKDSLNSLGMVVWIGMAPYRLVLECLAQRKWHYQEIWPCWCRCGLIGGSITLWRWSLRLYMHKSGQCDSVSFCCLHIKM